MKPQLLPHPLKKIGWILLLPGLIPGILKGYLLRDIRWLSYVTNAVYENVFVDMMNTVLICGMLIGALLVVFSREKQEDAFIQNLRLSSFGRAVLVNYLILPVCVLLFYGRGFLNVFAVNMFTTLLMYIVRFNYLLILSLSKRS